MFCFFYLFKLIWILQFKTGEVGKYRIGQILVRLTGLELLAPVPLPQGQFVVERVKSSVEVKQTEGELLAGLLQNVEMILYSGSYAINEVVIYAFIFQNTVWYKKIMKYFLS